MKIYTREMLQELLDGDHITDGFRVEIELAIQQGGDAIDALGEPGLSVGNLDAELLGEHGELRVDVEKLLNGDDRSAGAAVDRVEAVSGIFDFDFLNLKRRAAAFWARWSSHIVFGILVGWVWVKVRKTPNEPKLSHGGGWRGLCRWAERWRRSAAQAVTAVAVGCSAWLGVAVSSVPIAKNC